MYTRPRLPKEYTSKSPRPFVPCTFIFLSPCFHKIGYGGASRPWHSKSPSIEKSRPPPQCSCATHRGGRVAHSSNAAMSRLSGPQVSSWATTAGGQATWNTEPVPGMQKGVRAKAAAASLTVKMSTGSWSMRRGESFGETVVKGAGRCNEKTSPTKKAHCC